MAFKYQPRDPALAAFQKAAPKVAVPPAATPMPPQPAPPPAAAPPLPDPDFAEVPGATASPTTTYQPLPLKKAITLRIDEDILAKFRATGPGWQTRINNCLRLAALRL